MTKFNYYEETKKLTRQTYSIIEDAETEGDAYYLKGNKSLIDYLAYNHANGYTIKQALYHMEELAYSIDDTLEISTNGKTLEFNHEDFQKALFLMQVFFKEKDTHDSMVDLTINAFNHIEENDLVKWENA